MRLALLKAGGVQSMFPVSESEVVIGRDDACDIVLDDPRASKKHARVSRVKNRFVVTDMESSNGTRVNERAVLAQTLRSGDALRIGRTLFLCLADKAPEAEEETGDLGCLTVELPEREKATIPIARDPILVGASSEAAVRLSDEGTPEFQTQIATIPGGIQVTDLAETPPRCALVRPGEFFRVGSARFAFHAATVKPQTRIPSEPPPSGAGDNALVEPPDAPDAKDADKEESGETFSVLARTGRLGKALEAEADYADLAAPSADYESAAPPFRAGAFKLTGVTGPCKDQVFGLTGKRVVVGRGEQCGIRLNDGSVSREHAVLERVEGDMVVEDLRSSNGVFVNGRRVRRHPLKAGDKIRIGMNEFLVHL